MGWACVVSIKRHYKEMSKRLTVEVRKDMLSYDLVEGMVYWINGCSQQVVGNIGPFEVIWYV